MKGKSTTITIERIGSAEDIRQRAGNIDAVVLFHLQRDENEQQSLKPLERKIIFEYGLDEFVVYTDGGLGSMGNRRSNDRFGRKFVTT